MLSQRLANVVFAIVVLAVAAYFGWIAQGFKAAGLLASSGLPSRFFPQLVLGGIAFCAATVLTVYLTKGAAGGDDGKTVYAERTGAARGLATLGVVIAAYAVWHVWGYVPMAIFAGPATCLAMGVRAPRIYVAVLALTGLVYLAFTQLLGTRF